MKFNTKRKIKNNINKIIYFLLHPFTISETANIKRLFKKKLNKNRPDIYQYIKL